MKFGLLPISISSVGVSRDDNVQYLCLKVLFVVV